MTQPAEITVIILPTLGFGRCVSGFGSVGFSAVVAAAAFCSTGFLSSSVFVIVFVVFVVVFVVVVVAFMSSLSLATEGVGSALPAAAAVVGAVVGDAAGVLFHGFTLKRDRY